MSVPDDVTAASYWQLIAESIPHIVWVASPDGRIEYLNQQGHEYTGWPSGAPLDDMVAVLVHPDDAASASREWADAMAKQAAYSTEYRLRRADGEYRWHRGGSRPITDAGREVVNWIGTAIDVDDHKRSEAALGETAERLRETAEALARAQRLAHLGSWSLDVATGRRLWSDELYRLLGRDPDELEPDQEWFLERLHPDDAGRVRAAFLAQESRTESWEDEFRIVMGDGAVRWLAAHTEPIFGDGGELVQVHGTSQDVTVRRLAEERSRFQADLLDAVGEAVIATAPDGSVIYWGPGAEELYGWKANDVLSRSIMEVIPAVPAADPATAAEIMERLSRGKPYTGIMVLERQDGSTFVAEVTDTPVLDHEGQLVGIIGTSSDVSERHHAQERLQGALRAAEESRSLLTALQAEAPVGLAFVDRHLRLVSVNNDMASFLGAPVDEVLGARIAEVLPPAYWDQVAPVYRHVLATGETVRGEWVLGPDGSIGQTREIMTSHYPVHVGGEIIGVGVVVQDLTDQLRAERSRSAVMSRMAEGVCTLDPGGRVRSMNVAASRMLGWSENELRGKALRNVVKARPDGSPDSIEVEFPALGPSGEVGQFRSDVFVRKDGSSLPVAYSAIPLNIGSALDRVVVMFKDVSEPGSTPNVISVLIADSDSTAARSFKALLDHHEGVQVVGVASDSVTALASAEGLSPDVVLVNLEFSDGDGLTTASAIKHRSPSTNVILMAPKYDDAIALACIEAGCAGLLDKGRAWVELVSAVRAAYHGETIISQDELQRVLSKVRDGGHLGRSTQLTDREEEVLGLMRRGLSNAQVAERLAITPNTVRNHVQRILYKLNVHSKLEAVVITSREGLEQDPPN